jgi:hypothetical protein
VLDGFGGVGKEELVSHEGKSWFAKAPVLVGSMTWSRSLEGSGSGADGYGKLRDHLGEGSGTTRGVGIDRGCVFDGDWLW